MQGPKPHANGWQVTLGDGHVKMKLKSLFCMGRMEFQDEAQVPDGTDPRRLSYPNVDICFLGAYVKRPGSCISSVTTLIPFSSRFSLQSLRIKT